MRKQNSLSMFPVGAIVRDGNKSVVLTVLYCL